MNVEILLTSKFTESSDMTFQEVFEFSFSHTIPVIESIANELGRDLVFEALKKAAYNIALENGHKISLQMRSNDFSSFNEWARSPTRFWNSTLTFEIVEDSPKAFELKVTECLWAKVLRDMNAEEIGYNLICQCDFGLCKGFNPDISLTRSKTLMQGDDCCNHRWIIE